MSAILLVATLQSWFFTFSIWKFKKNKQPSDWILLVWFIFIGSHTLTYFTFANGYSFNVYLLILNASFPFLQGPFLFFYVSSKVRRINKPKAYHFLHLLPFLFFIAYQLANIYIPETGSHGEVNLNFVPFFSPNNLFGLIFLTSLPIYIMGSYIITINTKIQLVNRAWIYLMILFISSIWLSSMVSFFKPESMSHQLQIIVNNILFIVLTGFIYTASYFSLKEHIYTTDIPTIGKTKYEKSKLSQVELDNIIRKMDQLMRVEKQYLNPDLSLILLSEMLNTTPNKLSQAINNTYAESFNDYVNRFRINHAKKLIKSGRAKQYTLLALGIESGFNSKSTFNRVFRKFENKSPSSYMDSIKN